MAIRDILPPILRGEGAADLAPEVRQRLESVADQAREERLLPFLRDECSARLKQPGATAEVEYLLAMACALNGEIERSHQTLLALGERLAAAKRWEPLAAVAERALALDETHAAARLLVKAHEGLAKDPERIEALERATAMLPDDLDMALLLAIRLGEAGRAAERRALLADLTPRFAEEGRYPGIEEAALEFAEHRDVDGLVRVLHALPMIAARGAIQECRQLAEIAFPLVAAAGRAGECHDSLRLVAARAIEAAGPSAAEPFRGAVLESLRQGPARTLPDPQPVLDRSGVADPLKPMLEALERFDTMAVLPPGRAVVHGSFGPGRVVSNDGETVTLQFASPVGRQMPYAAARRSLLPLAEDDLRLLAFTDPVELSRLRREDPGEVLVRGLKAMGGSADAEKLKVFLVGSKLIPPGEWTAFFRKARAAATKDPRIDHARAYEQHYRLATAGAEAEASDVEIPLPALEPRKPAKTNLATLRRFLAQHPQAEQALAVRFGRFVERLLFDEQADGADRARAGLYFARWFPDRRAEWGKALQGLWDSGLALSDLSGEEEQLALLEESHAAGVEADAILSGLDSRFAAVREVAQRRREGLDAAGRQALRGTLLDHAPRYPAAALRLLEHELAGSTPPEDRWRMLWAALALIEERPKPSVAEKVLGWLRPDDAFDRWLREGPAPESLTLKLTVLLRQWRSSDRYLFPALEIADRLGLADAVAAVRAARRQSSQRLFDDVGKPADVELHVMTRATWSRLKKELERLERELRTTIPATIQKARELGDLRENAEFHSAKLKQANVSKQVASLQVRLARARFVDDAELKDGVVGLGTEVVLESEQDLTTYWILGEGEHHHGEHVISFQTPVGRALVGKAIGDEVELGEEDERRRYRVISIERKLPPDDRDDDQAL